MKLPRWLVISMLTSSALAVLTVGGWWWVMWPERTAREVVETLNGERPIDFVKLCAPPLVELLSTIKEGELPARNSPGAEKFETKADPRTLIDVMSGRLVCRGTGTEADSYFIVQRGSVVDLGAVDTQGGMSSIKGFAQ